MIDGSPAALRRRTRLAGLVFAAPSEVGAGAWTTAGGLTVALDTLFTAERRTTGTSRGTLLRDGCRPVLTHFNGPTKPWHGPRFASDHPARREIEAYVLKSPWRDFLSKHYDFRAAWDTLQAKRGAATYAAPRKVSSFSVSSKARLGDLSDYLRETEFADVRQGIAEGL